MRTTCPVTNGKKECGAGLTARRVTFHRSVQLNERHEPIGLDPEGAEWQQTEVWCEAGHYITPRHYRTLADGGILRIDIEAQP